MKNDLIERYVYAATKRLSSKQREDVAKELHTLIDDMLMERCGGTTPTEKDIRVVLTELGSPAELSMKYNENEKQCLIGQPYYSTYIFVLKIVMAAYAGGVIIAYLVSSILKDRSIVSVLGTMFLDICSGVTACYAVITCLFSILADKEIPITKPFDFDDLPSVPNKNKEISKRECVFDIVMSVILAVVLLGTPQIMGAYSQSGSMIVPVFDTVTLRGTWYIIVAFVICSIVRESVQLIEGRYNKRVMTTSLITNGISVILVLWWLLGFNLMNPTFMANIGNIFEGENIIINMFSNFQMFLLTVMLIALAADTAEVIYKTLRK